MMGNLAAAVIRQGPRATLDEKVTHHFKAVGLLMFHHDDLYVGRVLQAVAKFGLILNLT